MRSEEAYLSRVPGGERMARNGPELTGLTLYALAPYALKTQVYAATDQRESNLDVERTKLRCLGLALYPVMHC